jgi:hypothetical protein
MTVKMWTKVLKYIWYKGKKLKSTDYIQNINKYRDILTLFWMTCCMVSSGWPVAQNITIDAGQRRKKGRL